MKTNWNKTLITVGISALACVAAQTAKSQPATLDRSSSERDVGTRISAQQFVWQAATTDMQEINAGELALQKSDNADVKSFAKHLISDHKNACKNLQAIAEKENLSFPDTNSVAMGDGQWNSNSNWNENALNAKSPMAGGPDHHVMKGAELIESKNQMMTNDDEWGSHPIMLETLSGSEFDRAFAVKMVKGHEKAIRQYEMAAAHLTDEDLKNYAQKTLPTLREHLKMAQELETKVGLWTDSGMTNSLPMHD